MPRMRPGRREVDEPLRLRHRQRLEQHLVEQRIDRRVRADAERERQDRDDRDERRFEQRSKRQLQIPHCVGRERLAEESQI